MADKNKKRREKEKEKDPIQVATPMTEPGNNFVPVAKDLAYTKPMYEELLASASGMLEGDGLDGMPPDDRAAVYSIYYEAIAGFLRAGTLCSRVTSVDGLPEIRVVSGNRTYSCKEDVLIRIFGNNVAEEIIKPYEDLFNPYISFKPYAPIPEKDVGDVSELEKQESLQIRQLKNSHRKELSALRKKHEAELKARTEQDKKKDDRMDELKHEAKILRQEKEELLIKIEELTGNTEKLGEELDKSREEIRKAAADAEANIPAAIPLDIDPIPDDNSEQLHELEEKLKNTEQELKFANDRISELEDENGTLNREAEKERAEYNESASKYKKEIARQKKEIDEHNKYVYDPNYDHYYSDELPQILDSIDFTRTDIGIRAAAVAMCVGGIIISLLFII